MVVLIILVFFLGGGQEGGGRGGLMVSALDFGSRGPGSSHGRTHLGKILYSHSASLHRVPANVMLGANPAMD